MRRKKPDSEPGSANALTVHIQFAGGVSVAPLKPARLRELARASVNSARAAGRSRRVLRALTLRFVARAEARQLNAAFRQADYAPNVLTFEYPDLHAADIVICPPVVRAQAGEQRKPYADHLSHMVVHGVLHSLGHTHEDPVPACRMEALERAILARFRIADPYTLDAPVAQAG